MAITDLDLVCKLAVCNDVWPNEAVQNRRLAAPGSVLREHGQGLSARVTVDAELVEALPTPARRTRQDVLAASPEAATRGRSATID